MIKAKLGMVFGGSRFMKLFLFVKSFEEPLILVIVCGLWCLAVKGLYFFIWISAVFGMSIFIKDSGLSVYLAD
jgi:hypothetical protein